MEADLLYARISTTHQDSETPRRRLTEAGVFRLLEDAIGGKHFERAVLAELLNYARCGDVLCVVRLNRLGYLR